MNKYTVRTLHPGSNRFICPIQIEAESQTDAAEQRFKCQLRVSQEATRPVLVTGVCGALGTWLFNVEAREVQKVMVEVKPTLVPAR